jgi:endonuclease YncB( thermonuclease family)
VRSQLSIFLSIFSFAIVLIVPAHVSAQPVGNDLQIPEGAVPARYVENIDGDTIIVEQENVQGDFWEYTVRLIGIDTPENSYSYGNEPECYGREATNKTDSLLVTAKDGLVWLEADKDDEDPYGRLLRYV